MADQQNEQVAGDMAASALERIRLNVLAFGSPSTSRYIALITALLCTGLFVGDWVYNQVLGRHWIKVVVDCAGQAVQTTLHRRVPLPPVQAEITQQALQARCRGAAEIGRAIFALGGVGVAAACGLVIIYLAPVLVRRRRRLRPLDPPLHEASHRFAELAARSGLRRAPRAERGSARQRDGFSYGSPGRPRVVLPPAVAVRWRDRELFEPLVLHELAHVRHRDVALAWLARSVWYAVAPLVAVPIVMTLLSGDRSILADFAWRAALLGLTVLLVSTALLRSREHDADLRVGMMAGSADALIAMLRNMPAHRPRSQLRQLTARHPTPSQRVLILQNPERAADLMFVDGFTPAFLAALLLPLVVNVLVIVYTGTGRTGIGELAATLLAGALLGGSVGVGVWRRAIVGRIAGGSARIAPLACGVAVGLVLGQLASLANTGTGVTAGLYQPAWLVLSAVLGAGATALSAGMGRLWADSISLKHRHSVVTASVVVSGLTFAAALWIATSLQFELDNRGVAFGRAWLVLTLPSASLVAVTVALLALSAAGALWARGRRRTASARPGERGSSSQPAVSMRGRQWVVAALTCGIAAEGCLVALRFIAGPATSFQGQAQRYYLLIWVAAAAGGACTAALSLLGGVGGTGVAGVAAPLATVTAVAAFLVVNTALGGHLSWQYALTVAKPPLSVGLGFTLIGALVGLRSSPSRSPRQTASARLPAPRALMTYLVPAVSALIISVVLIIGRGIIIGPGVTLVSVNARGSTAMTAARYDGLHYLDASAAAIVATDAPARRAISAVRDTGNSTRAVALIRSEVLPRLRTVLRLAESVRPGTPQLIAIHYACLSALRRAYTGFSLLAKGLRGDPSAYAKAKLTIHDANIAWTAWQVGLLELMLGEGIPLRPSAFGLSVG